MEKTQIVEGGRGFVRDAFCLQLMLHTLGEICISALVNSSSGQSEDYYDAKLE